MIKFAPKNPPVLTDEWGRSSFQLYVSIIDGDSSPNSNLYFIIGNAATDNGMVFDGDKLAKVIEVNPSGLVSRKSSDVLKTYTSNGKSLCEGTKIYTTITISYNTYQKTIVVEVIV